MGVMACNRDGCDHIMCDRCILDNTAYICLDCYEELLEYKKGWPREMTAAQIRKRVEEFMESKVGTYQPVHGIDINREFARLMGDG